MTTFLILCLIGLLIGFPIYIYNRIIRYRNQTDNAFGSIDAMLKKRYDLIPNIVEVIKQYAQHEANILTEVTKMRSQMYNSKNIDEKIEMYNDISKKLGNMFVNFENYPDLKANVNFLRLQANWTESEEQIAASRRFYNASVTDFNNSIQTFPSNIFANIFIFQPKKVLEITDEERNNISAKALFNK